MQDTDLGTSDRQRALLMDGHNLLFRAFSSVPRSITDSEDRPVNGIYGMIGTLLKLIRERRPQFVGVAFDVPEVPTFRHGLYPAYQGQRGPLGGVDAANFAWQIDGAKAVLTHIGIRWLTAPGYEADDILATLSAMASRKEVCTTIVTTDRDLQQLVRDEVTVLIPGKSSLEVDMAAVEARLGIPPNRIVDWKALAGDPSDNIPGVPGIGDKSAVDLVKKYGTCQGIYDHLDEIPTRQRNALEDGRQMAELFQEVVRLKRDLTLYCAIEDLRVDIDSLPDRAGTALQDAGLRPEAGNG